MNITLETIHTPLGPLWAAFTPHGLALLEFCDRFTLERNRKFLMRRFPHAAIVETATPSPLAAQLHDYFNGVRWTFDVALDAGGTRFQRQVWNRLQTIPAGHTMSYAAVADALGKLDAVRAMARANGQNPLSIVIPCHRVIGSDGALTGYGGGLWRKKWLLEHESRAR
jgi:AraC family transcriptional regulator of adaptative response/methylated-DNA-[protein]-cysteine methyltransferase